MAASGRACPAPVHRLHPRHHPGPGPATVDALAEGLGVPVSAVRASAVEFTAGCTTTSRPRPGRRTRATGKQSC